MDVTVEIPQGGRNKYEVDHDSGRLRLDRQLFTSTCYPAEYGFIEGTLGLDGDPLDALVLTAAPTFPGCLIDARAIGAFVMTDEHGSDNKMLTVPSGDPRYDHLLDIHDLAVHVRAEIAHFFEVYKQLEPGKPVTGISWAGRVQASREIEESIERHHNSHSGDRHTASH